MKHKNTINTESSRFVSEPQNPCHLYKQEHSLSQEFNSHSEELDPARIKEIAEQAIKDLDWVVDKVNRVHAYSGTSLRPSVIIFRTDTIKGTNLP